jgi:hypothetical protein
MYEYEEFTILPIFYNGHLPYEDVYIDISAETTEDDYKCRDSDVSRETIILEDSLGDRIYASLSNNDAWMESIRKSQYDRSITSEIISESVGEQICLLFSITCPYGKYPHVEIFLEEDYYEEVYEVLDSDKNRGILDGQYRIRIYIPSLLVADSEDIGEKQ